MLNCVCYVTHASLVRLQKNLNIPLSRLTLCGMPLCSDLANELKPQGGGRGVVHKGIRNFFFQLFRLETWNRHICVCFHCFLICNLIVGKIGNNIFMGPIDGQVAKIATSNSQLSPIAVWTNHIFLFNPDFTHSNN